VLCIELKYSCEKNDNLEIKFNKEAAVQFFFTVEYPPC
jgi:hypothetical protein